MIDLALLVLACLLVPALAAVLAGLVRFDRWRKRRAFDRFAADIASGVGVKRPDPERRERATRRSGA